MTRFPKLVGLVLLVSLSAGGCSRGEGGEAPTEAVQQLEATTPVTAVPTAPMGSAAPPADPYAVPAVIDAAYVNRVMAAIGKVRVRSRTHILNGRFDSETESYIRSVYGGVSLEFGLRNAADEALAPRRDIRKDPVPSTVAVNDIKRSTSSCIWFLASVDDKANQLSPSNPGRIEYVLRSQEHDRDLNPTPWVITRATSPGLVAEHEDC